MADFQLKKQGVSSDLDRQFALHQEKMAALFGRNNNYLKSESTARDNGACFDGSHGDDFSDSGLRFDEKNNGVWTCTDPLGKSDHVSQKKCSDYLELQEKREQLPIYAYKDEFIAAVKKNQVVVLVGETGSGKSTQMPQYLLETGTVKGPIAITQPRRVAAVSVCERVAEELACEVGDLVGYSIRFESVTSDNTVIRYLTDGLLMTEAMRDPTFANYDAIILDEVHERTLHTDIVLGLVKKVLKSRTDLKVIVTSATLEVRKFAAYFDNAPVIRIPGKVFPVSIVHMPANAQSKIAGNMAALPLWLRAKKPSVYIQLAVSKVATIVRDNAGANGDSGDILVFMPGKDEVETTCSYLGEILGDFVAVLPAYGAQPFDAQCRIFAADEKNRRKIIVATNIAETSITLDGITFVIDVGLFKESAYDNGIDTLKVCTISKAQAAQRAGRAGRTAAGTCYRMYTESDYARMSPCQSPAIHRINLMASVLHLKAMGIDDILGFGFMDPPKPERVAYCLRKLFELGAVTERNEVTDLGHKMAEFPLSPNLAKILLMASYMECSDDVLTIVSMLSVKYIFVWPKNKQREAREKKKQFNDPMGDHLTYMDVFKKWTANQFDEGWARSNFIHQKEMEKAKDIRKQLDDIMTRHGVPVIKATPKTAKNIRKALSTGLPNHVAVKDNASSFFAKMRGYRTLVDHQLVYIHPSSSLFGISSSEQPERVIYHEIVNTSKAYMRVVSICENDWIPPGLAKRRL